MEKKVKNFKECVLFVGSMSVGKVVGDAVMHVVPNETKLFGKVMSMIGGYVLSEMIMDEASGYLDTKFDKVVEKMKELSTEDEEEN